MAKKEKHSVDDIDLSFELDFDSEEPKPTTRKEAARKAVTDAAKSSFSSAKSTVLSKSAVNTFLKGALPKEYAETLDNTKEVRDTVSSLYNEAARDVKPNVDRIMREVDKLVPQNMKRSKSFLGKLKKLLNVEDQDSGFSGGNSNENTIQSNLAEIFKATAERTEETRAEEKAEGMIKEKIEARRFKSSFGVLSSMNTGIARIAAYNERVNAAYQKKSLELQYRSFFLQKDMLETTKKYFDTFKRQNDDIVRNTGLPDFVKMTKAEIFKDVTMRKFFGSSGKLFSNNQFLKQGVENLKKAGQEQIKNFTDALGTLADGLEQSASMKEAMGDAGISGASAIGMAAGGMAGQKAVDILAAKLKGKVPPEVLKMILKVHSKTLNVRRTFKEARNSDLLKENPDDELTRLGGIKNKGKNILGTLMDIFNNSGVDLKLKNGGGLKGLSDQALFDRRTQKSITTVIPGFLSRIYRELQILRTGNTGIELTDFDHGKDRFTSKSKLAESTKKNLSSALKRKDTSDEIENTMSIVAGKSKMSEGASKAVKLRLEDLAFSGKISEVEDLLDEKFLKQLSPEIAIEIRNMVNSNLLGKSNGSNRDKFNASVDKTQESIGDIRAQIEEYYLAGYGDVLKKLKIIKQDGKDFVIDLDGYKEIYRSGKLQKAITAANESKGRKKTTPGSIGTTSQKSRPQKTQQSVNNGASKTSSQKQPGEHALLRPATIGQLSSYNYTGIKFDTFGAQQSPISDNGQIEVLKSIKEDTGKIVDRLSAIGQVGFGMPEFSKMNFRDYIKNFRAKVNSKTGDFRARAGSAAEGMKEKASDAKKRFSDKIAGYINPDDHSVSGLVKNIGAGAGALLFKTMETASDKLKKANKDIIQPGIEKGKEIYKKNKEPAIAMAKDLFNKGVELVGTVYDRAKSGLTDLIKNKLPTGAKALASAFEYGKDKLKQILDAPVDIYVKGRPNPVLQATLMRAGAYFDQRTGKPIRIPSEINGPVINQDGEVVLSMDDFAKGITDKDGKPIRSISAKLTALALGAVGAVGSRLKAGLEGLMEIGGGIKDRLKGGLAGLLGFGKGAKRVVEVLIQIRDMLNKRMPGKKENFTNSFDLKTGHDVKSKSQTSKKESDQGDKKDKTPSFFGKMGESLKAIVANTKATFFEQKEENDREEEKARQEKRGERENGWQARLKRGADAAKERLKGAKNNMADNAPKYKGKNVIDMMIDGAAGAYDKIKDGLGLLGNVVGGAAGSGLGGKLLGAAGTLGRGALAVGKGALSMGGAAVRGGLSLAGNIGVRGLLASGSLLTGGIGSAIAGTASMAMGGLSAIMASPVTLPLAVAALAGYGIYKGVKFLGRNKASLLTRVRLAQYGLLADQSSEFHRIFELEEYLESECLGFADRQAKLLENKIDATKILEIFGTDVNDQEMTQRVVQWFNGRFKPVFLTHMSALFAVDNKAPLSKIDDLKSDQKERYSKAACNTPNVYSVTASPLKDFDTLPATSKDVDELLKEARDEWKDDLNDDGSMKEGLFKTAAKSAFSFMTRNEGLENLAKEGGIKGAIAKVLKAVPGFAMLKNITDPVSNLLIGAGAKIGEFASDIFSKGWSPLEAIRFRIYGLNTPMKFKTASLRKFEAYMAPLVVVKNGEGATFEGDVNKVIADTGSYFGISSIEDKQGQDWAVWFKKRFLPVFLVFVGNGAKKLNKQDPNQIEISLSSSESFELASAMLAVPDTWSTSESPWGDGEALCDSSSECKENLNYLQDQARKETVSDQFKRPDKTETSSPGKIGDNKKESSERIKQLEQSAQKELDKIGEEERAKDFSKGSAPSETMSSSGKIPSLGGALADPSAGQQFLSLGKGVKLDGLNPELSRNLKMMAAEYGQMTGKSIPVTSGSRTFEEQSALYKSDPSKAARPGTSLHEHGLAIDVDPATLDELDKLGLMRKYGFTRPVGGEKWHMEPAGIQTNISLAKSDTNYATEAIKSSLGRGGGGYGSLANSAKGRRNPLLARSLLEDAASGNAVAQNSSKETANTVLAKGPDVVTKTATDVGTAGVGTASTMSGSEISSSKNTVLAKADPDAAKTIAGNEKANAEVSKGEVFKDTEPGSMGKIANQVESMAGGDVRTIIKQAAKESGVDENLLTTFAAIESGLKPDARSNASSATGLGQFISSTWQSMLQKYGRKYNLDPNTQPTDPRASALMMAEYIKENRKALHSVVREPGPTELYLAHFLGTGGARQFLKADPSAIAATLFPKQAKSNPTIFYDNGRPRTIQEVQAFLKNKVYSAARQYGIALADNPTQSPRTTGGTVLASNDRVPGTIPPPSTSTGEIPKTTGGNSSQPQGDQKPRTDAPGVDLPPSRPVPRTTSGPSILGIPKTTLPGIGNSTRTTPIEQGKSFDVAGLSSSISNIDTTLSKSLSVQEQILESIKMLVSNTAPENLQALTKGLADIAGAANRSTSGGKAASPLPPSPVSLQRTGV